MAHLVRREDDAVRLTDAFVRDDVAARTRDEVEPGHRRSAEDRRRDDERDVGGVDVAGLEVAAALEADEDLVTGVMLQSKIHAYIL